MADKTKYIVTDDSSYTLSTDKKSTDSQELIILGSEDQALALTTDIKLVLKRIDYDKKMYNPGHVKLTFSQKASYPWKDVNAELKTFIAKSSTFCLKLKSGKTGDTTTYNDIATDYYCYNAKIQNFVSYTEDDAGRKKSIANYRVVLDCYSEDHKLTLYPSCNAWTGKKFVGEIIPDLLEKYKLDKSLLSDAKKLSVLLATDSDGKNETEIPLPYLVQYNESPYDFMCRVANRCGEFLYNEDGKLCVGLKKENFPDQVDTKESSAVSDAFVQFGDNVCDYDPNVNLYTNAGDVNAKGSSSAYNGSYINDAFCYIDKQDEYKYKWDFWMYLAIAGEILGSESNAEILSNAASSFADSFWFYNYVQDAAHDDATKVFETYAKDLGLIEACKNIVNNTFSKIENREKLVSSGKVTLDFQSSTMHDLKLGQNVYVSKLGEQWNIVTSIHGFLSKETNDNPVEHYVDVVPVLNYAADEETPKITKLIPPFDNRPHIHSAVSQEAVVTHVDDPCLRGRVRVRFMWQTEKGDASPWLRMTTPFAGSDEATGGFFMMPEVNSHVMVNFMHDNIEMPYVDGALFYKGKDKYSSPDLGFVGNHKWYFQPSFKRRVLASGNGSSLSFVDGSGACNFLGGMLPVFGAFMGMTTAPAKAFNAAAGEAFECVEGNIVLRDANGINEINMSTSGRNISVSSPIGSVSINAFTGITINAPNGDINIKGKNVNITAGNNVTIKSGTNIQDEHNFATSFAEECASVAEKALIDFGKLKLLMDTGINISKLLDIKFLRSVWEVIMRPVEGSLAINSKRNVLMTAGKGKVTVPTSNLAHAKTWGKNWNQKKADSLSYKKTYALIDTLEALRRALDGYYTPVLVASNQLTSAFKNLHKKTRNYYNGDVGHPLHNIELLTKFNSFLAWDEINVNLLYSFANAVGLDIANHKFQDIPVANVGYVEVHGMAENNNRYKINQMAIDFTHDAKDFLGKLYALLKVLNNNNDLNKLPENFDDILVQDKINLVQKLNETLNDKKNVYQNLGGGSSIVCDAFDENDIKEANFQSYDTILHKVFQKVLEANKDLLDYDFDNKQRTWKQCVDSIKEKKGKLDGVGGDLLKTLGSNVVGALGFNIDFDDMSNNDAAKLVNAYGKGGPRAAWEVGHGGGIYMSNNPAMTCAMNKDGKSWFAVANPGLARLKAYLLDPKTYADRQSIAGMDNLEQYFTKADNNIKEQDIKIPEEDI